jgi:hypothetical protein
MYDKSSRNQLHFLAIRNGVIVLRFRVPYGSHFLLFGSEQYAHQHYSSDDLPSLEAEVGVVDEAE